MDSTIPDTQEFDTELKDHLNELMVHRRASSFRVEKSFRAARSQQLDSKISQLHDATYRASLKPTLESILEARPIRGGPRLSESKARWHDAKVDTIVQNFVNENPSEKNGSLLWPTKGEDWSIGVPLASCDLDEFQLDLTPIVPSCFKANGDTVGQLIQQSVIVPWEPVPSAEVSGTIKEVLRAERRTAAEWGLE